MPCPNCGGHAVTITRKIGDRHVVLCDLDHAFVVPRNLVSKSDTNLLADTIALVLIFCTAIVIWIALPS